MQLGSLVYLEFSKKFCKLVSATLAYKIILFLSKSQHNINSHLNFQNKVIFKGKLFGVLINQLHIWQYVKKTSEKLTTTRKTIRVAKKKKETVKNATRKKTQLSTCSSRKKKFSKLQFHILPFTFYGRVVKSKHYVTYEPTTGKCKI